MRSKEQARTDPYPTQDRLGEQQRLLAAELMGALTDRQLRVFYQPVVDLETGVMRSVEALILNAGWSGPLSASAWQRSVASFFVSSP